MMTRWQSYFRTLTYLIISFPFLTPASFPGVVGGQNSLFAASLASSKSSSPRLYVHDATFQPDRILRVTAIPYPMDCMVRYSVVINGTVPGPMLRFREGDAVWVRVYNDMTDQNLTIHWHGLTQRMSPFSDGTPAVSQWPIPPLHYFDYEFRIQYGDAGTYFYHSHVGFQAITAAGALIIEEARDKNGPYHYDDERTLFLTDVYHLTDAQLMSNVMANPFRPSGEPRNIAVNGQSRAVNATRDQTSSSCAHAVIPVQPDRLYRLRFIGATSVSQIYLAFEGHEYLVLMEVDGHYVAPVFVNHIQIHSGQRYSVVFRSKSLAQLRTSSGAMKLQYFIQLETRSRPAITRSYAVLAYEIPGADRPDTFSAPTKPPLALPAETFSEGWLEDELHPLPWPLHNSFEAGGPPLAEEVTRRVVITSQLRNVNNGSLIFVDAGFPWYETTPVEPYLVSLYRNATHFFPNYTAAVRNGGYDPATKTFPARLGEVLEIVWLSLGNAADARGPYSEGHPWHAHGNHVWDIGSGLPHQLADVEARLRRRIRNGGIIQRDTSILYRANPNTTFPPGSFVTWRIWRIRVRTPGVWMLHCHMLPHMMMGMNTVFVFGHASDLQPLPPRMAAGYLTYGGTAFGNATFRPTVAHYWHP